MDIVERLHELLAKATPRPWKASPYRGCIGSQVWAGEPGPDTATLICGDGDADDVNAELIATAVNALPDLLAEITRLRDALRKIEVGSKFSTELFGQRVRERKGRLTWWAVNGLQDSLAACQCTARTTLEQSPKE